MEKEIEVSIQRYESKKEFRAVRLQTRDSFREDQAALEKRLSKYRRKSEGKSDGTENRITSNGQTNGKLNGIINGHVNESFVHENGANFKKDDKNGMSKLESIVLDLSLEKEKDSDCVNADMDNAAVSNLKNGEGGESFYFGGIESPSPESSKIDPTDVKIDVNGTETTKTRSISSSVSSEQNVEHVTLSMQQTNINGGIPNGHVTQVNGNGNGFVPNGHVQASSLVMRPKVVGETRGSMTPEPKMKFTQGIYQKNPKLTSASTDHLDNISLRSFKSGQKPPQEGQGQVFSPIIPAAEVSSLPPDGNLVMFSVSQMVTIFRLLNLPGELIYRLSRCKVDGRRFAMFSDQELEELGINNPIIRYFRDRSGAPRPRRKKPFFVL